MLGICYLPLCFQRKSDEMIQARGILIKSQNTLILVSLASSLFFSLPFSFFSRFTHPVYVLHPTHPPLLFPTCGVSLSLSLRQGAEAQSDAAAE